jgi:hypothetical protein
MKESQSKKNINSSRTHRLIGLDVFPQIHTLKSNCQCDSVRGGAFRSVGHEDTPSWMD